MSKKNPNKIPCSKAMSEELSETAFNTAIACTISTVAETEKMTFEEMQKLWDSINSTSDVIVKNGRKHLMTIVDELENEYDLKCVRFREFNPTTLGQAQRRAKMSYGLACAIMMSEVAKTGKYSKEEIKEIWNRIGYKEDSIRKEYCNLREVCETLKDEYGLLISGVLGHQED